MIRLKEKGIRIVILFYIIFTAVLFASVTNNSENVYAAGKQSKALKAYREFLESNKIRWGQTSVNGNEMSFMLKDLDGDKIPELIVSCVSGSASDGYERIYTYKNKVKEILVAVRGTFTYYPSKHIVKARYVGWMGIDNTRWYKIQDGKADLIAYKDSNLNTTPSTTYYGVENDDVKKNEYKKYIKKLQCKKLKKSWKINSKENLDRYLTN